MKDNEIDEDRVERLAHLIKLDAAQAVLRSQGKCGAEKPNGDLCKKAIGMKARCPEHGLQP